MMAGSILGGSIPMAWSARRRVPRKCKTHAGTSWQRNFSGRAFPRRQSLRDWAASNGASAPRLAGVVSEFRTRDGVPYVVLGSGQVVRAWLFKAWCNLAVSARAVSR